MGEDEGTNAFGNLGAPLRKHFLHQHTEVSGARRLSLFQVLLQLLAHGFRCLEAVLRITLERFVDDGLERRVDVVDDR